MRVHPAVFVEVGVEHPGSQRLAKVDRNRRSAGADDHARDPLRMRRPPRTARPRSRRRARRCAAGRARPRRSARRGTRPSPAVTGGRRAVRRHRSPAGRSANRRACSASVAHIGANAYTLSGHGLVSSSVGSREPPAVGVTNPDTVDSPEVDIKHLSSDQVAPGWSIGDDAPWDGSHRGALDRRPAPPGQHAPGQARPRSRCRVPPAW